MKNLPNSKSSSLIRPQQKKIIEPHITFLYIIWQENYLKGKRKEEGVIDKCNKAIRSILSGMEKLELENEDTRINYFEGMISGLGIDKFDEMGKYQCTYLKLAVKFKMISRQITASKNVQSLKENEKEISDYEKEYDIFKKILPSPQSLAPNQTVYSDMLANKDKNITELRERFQTKKNELESLEAGTAETSVKRKRKRVADDSQSASPSLKKSKHDSRPLSELEYNNNLDNFIRRLHKDQITLTKEELSKKMGDDPEKGFDDMEKFLNERLANLDKFLDEMKKIYLDYSSKDSEGVHKEALNCFQHKVVKCYARVQLASYMDRYRIVRACAEALLKQSKSEPNLVRKLVLLNKAQSILSPYGSKDRKGGGLLDIMNSMKSNSNSVDKGKRIFEGSQSMVEKIKLTIGEEIGKINRQQDEYMMLNQLIQKFLEKKKLLIAPSELIKKDMEGGYQAALRTLEEMRGIIQEYSVILPKFLTVSSNFTNQEQERSTALNNKACEWYARSRLALHTDHDKILYAYAKALMEKSMVISCPNQKLEYLKTALHTLRPYAENLSTPSRFQILADLYLCCVYSKDVYSSYDPGEDLSQIKYNLENIGLLRGKIDDRMSKIIKKIAEPPHKESVDLSMGRGIFFPQPEQPYESPRINQEPENQEEFNPQPGCSSWR